MATRIGIFLAALVMGLAVLVAHPWFDDPSFVPGGQQRLIIGAAIFSAIVFAIVLGPARALTDGIGRKANDHGC